MTTELTTVTISQFNTIGSDDRGLTANFSLPNQRDQFIYITRKSGTVSGNTYHTGKSVMTDPKIFLLLSGSIKFSYRHIDNTTSQTVTVNAPAKIEIPPYITHRVETITDSIFLECNALTDIEDDRIRLPV